MSVRLFDSGDREYLEWMRQHSHGGVANTGRSGDSRMFTIHQALCGHIKAYGPRQTPGCFTKRGSVKVGSLDVRELEDWAAQHRPLATEIKYC